MTTAGRDPEAARSLAADRLVRAQHVADAVDRFHRAADEIDAAQAAIAAASQARIDALQDMRSAGLSIAEVAELTALSPSRIQALTRGGSSSLPTSSAQETGATTEREADDVPPAEGPPALS